MRSVFPAAALAVSVLLASCQPDGGLRRLRLMPPGPVPGPPPEGWEVLVWRRPGYPADRYLLPPDGGEIVLAREVTVPVVARPLVPGFDRLPAGGVVFPGSWDVLALKWIDGAAAGLLGRRVRGGSSMESVNVLRFLDTARVRSGGNPWSLDLRRLAGDLAARRLSVHSFRPMAEQPVIIPVPSGRWIPDNPLEKPIDAVDGHLRADIPPGRRMFLREPDGPVLIIDMRDGDVLSYLRPRTDVRSR